MMLLPYLLLALLFGALVLALFGSRLDSQTINHLRAQLAAQPAPAVADHALLLAQLRRQDPQALTQAYRITFGGQIGRLVLTHWMAQCGVGGRQGAGLSPDDRAYVAGRHDAAIDLMITAGFDQPSAVLATLTDQLGDMDHERHAPDTSYAATGIDPADL